MSWVLNRFLSSGIVGNKPRYLPDSRIDTEEQNGQEVIASYFIRYTKVFNFSVIVQADLVAKREAMEAERLERKLTGDGAFVPFPSTGHGLD